MDFFGILAESKFISESLTKVGGLTRFEQYRRVGRAFIDIERCNISSYCQSETPPLLYNPSHFKIFFDVSVLSGSHQSMVK